jgi:hypothetical protein
MKLGPSYQGKSINRWRRREKRERGTSKKSLKKIVEIGGSYLYPSPSVIRIMKLMKMRGIGHVVRMGENRSAYRVFIENPDRERPLGRSRHRWKHITKIYIREIL